MDDMTSEPISESVGLRPAPEVPDAATTTMSVGATSPAASSGASARITDVG